MSRMRGNGEGTVYQRSDGRWEAAGYADLPMGVRKRIRVYAATRALAVSRLAEKIQEAQRGAYTPNSAGESLEEFITDWLERTAKPRLRVSTMCTYTEYTRRFIIPYLGRKALTGLSPKDLRSWLERLRAECQCCRQGFDEKRPISQRRCCALAQCCHKVLSAATIRYTHGILRTALLDAVREERLGRNVAKLVTPPAANSKRTEPWTAAEAAAFLAYVRGRERFAEAFELALRTGLRIGELLALSWDDVDLKAGTIRVRRSVRRHLGIGSGLVLSEPKTAASRRRIPLPPGCTELLGRQRQRERQKRHKAAAGEGSSETGLVFTTLTGTTLDPVHVSKAFYIACERSGVRRIRFHDLRHTCATLMLRGRPRHGQGSARALEDPDYRRRVRAREVEGHPLRTGGDGRHARRGEPRRGRPEGG